MLRSLALAALAMLAAAPSRAASITLAGQPVRGRVQFVFVGASMVDNQGLANGVNCLKPTGTARVRAAEVPSRARLLSATLYIGGSLIADDGPDYTNPTLNLFETAGLVADDPADLPFVEAAARAAADTSVELQPPGAASPVTVSSPLGSSSVSVYYKPPGGLEPGNGALFVTKIDVTDVVRATGQLAGDYTVTGLLADVCFGREAVCGNPPNPPNPPTCVTESAVHTNAAASFALLLVFEDPSLPYRTIGIFDGIQPLNNNLRTLVLDTTPISDPPAGRLAFYALEGDLGLSSYTPGSGPCNANEFIEVDGDDNPGAGGLCLVDDDNPEGNIFNSTINAEPKDAATTPSCTGDPRACCQGDGLCGVTGVDIDTFDITSALTPGADRVRATVSTGSDRVALGVVVLQADLFAPELETNTQIRVLSSADGKVQVGAPLVYSIAVSNKGNVPATNVFVRMSAPARTEGLELLRIPTGAVNQTTSFGGDAGTGIVLVSGFTVPAGQIGEIRFQTRTRCDALHASLEPAALVSSSEVLPFDVQAPPVRVVGPGIRDCEGIDPDGGFGDTSAAPIANRVLRGGGGCSAISADLLALLGLTGGLLAAGRLRRQRARRRRQP